jgi:hypothetical protein
MLNYFFPSVMCCGFRGSEAKGIFKTRKLVTRKQVDYFTWAS